MTQKAIVCIASEFKGNEFIEECSKAGWKVILVTRKDLLDSPWAWTSISETKIVEKNVTVEDYIRTITNVCGNQKIKKVVGLDEFDILTAAKAREHLQLDGMSSSYALRFRDKLQMRNLASKTGIPCPEFTGIFNTDEINEYLDTTKPPWIVKPRTEVSAFGIRKCETKEQVWQVITSLDTRNTWRDHPSQYLIERFIEGDVFHVDSVVYDGEVIAVGIGKYGKPPYKITHHGGVFTTSTFDYEDPDRKRLEQLNRHLIKSFRYEKGVTHAEFLRAQETGEFYLLEIACRVGGAYIANVHEYANGFNLWREWAKLEIEDEDMPYQPPIYRQEYAGICLALAKVDFPDTSHYKDPEIIHRVNRPKHVGLIFHTPIKSRLDELIKLYTERITEDFLAIAPAKEHYDDQ
ncbi:MAG: ATP-grasp domain-containing protein [Acidobacteria bacterium]|nr:MAG: ATP-grasp domain-containing protein [Acidobacteriota bacterium]